MERCGFASSGRQQCFFYLPVSQARSQDTTNACVRPLPVPHDEKSCSFVVVVVGVFLGEGDDGGLEEGSGAILTQARLRIEVARNGQDVLLVRLTGGKRHVLGGGDDDGSRPSCMD